MKRAVVVCNGDSPSAEFTHKIIRSTDFIICANGGSKIALKLGIIPHVAIGDLDSLSKKYVKELNTLKVKLIKHPKDKDQTDSELAIEFIKKKGIKSLVVFGIFGDRIDHFLGTLTYLSNQLKYFNDITIFSPKQAIFFTKNLISIEGKTNDMISLIPIKSDVKVDFTRGLRWELRNEILEYGKTRGVSNVFEDKKVEIKISSGTLMIVKSIRKY